VNRRSYLTCVMLVALVLSLLLSACAPTTEPQIIKETVVVEREVPVQETVVVEKEVPVRETVVVEKVVEVEVPAEAPISYNEAPMLARLVAAGELPPVEERLPKNPRVLPVYDEIGEYGGTWRRAYNGIGDRWGVVKVAEERIIEWYMPDPDTLKIVANWCDEYEMSPDATEFTFHIREGLKWSDGVEVTTEDVLFWYEDVFLFEGMGMSPQSYLTSAGEPLQIEVVDDYTFIVKFVKPYPLFPHILAKESTGPPGLQRDSFLLPKHYLMNYHPNYVSEEELDKAVAEYEVEVWQDLWHYGPIQNWFLNPDLPVISAWKIKVPPPADRIVLERNPYYWAVDSEGNQLPYIDEITHDFFEDPETVALWALQGNIDMQGRHISGADYTLYKENEEAGDYHVVTWRDASTGALYPNLNCPDEMLAELFDDVRFRHALSIGINREEINLIAYAGLGEPRQASPVSGSPYFDAEFETKWTEYNPDTANQLLDEMGLTERDADGFRLRPDGERLSIVLTYYQADADSQLEVVKIYWADLGIELLLRRVERSLYSELTDAGDIQIGYFSFDRSSVVSADPRRYLGNLADGPWAPLYGQWYETGGESGVEPPADHPIRDAWAAWEKAQTAPTIEEALAYMQEMISVHKENVWVIGIVGEAPTLNIVKNNFRNVPDNLISDDALRGPGIGQPAQFFIKH
jgi:peptide/nickel transport system substrate-binding protein